MAGEDKRAKTSPAPKSETTKEKSAPAAPAKGKVAEAAPAKAKDGEPAAKPSSYSKGEGQKPVSQAYKDNWNAIFAKKKRR